LSVTINPPPLTVTTTSLPAGTVGAAYSQTLAASGGTGGYTWSVTSGPLPAGLTLSAAGVISGTPAAAGASTFTVQVKDSSGTTATRALSIAINPAALLLTTTSLPGATAGASYSATLSASGGTGGYTWSVTAGSLPAGLSLSPSGAITGTPSSAGTASFTVQVQDSSGAKAATNLSISVFPALTVATASLPLALLGAPYSQTLSATGGSGGYVWSIAGGSLPAGLALSPGGVLAGTPQSSGAFSFTVKVTDAASVTATRGLTLSVASPVSVNVPGSLPRGQVGLLYSASLAASGGSGAYTWSITSGELPPGVALNSASGALAGAPTVAGTFSFTVQAADANGLTATATSSIEVRPELTIATDPTLAGASAGSTYSQTLTASGGTPPYSWSQTSGSLPAGLTLNGSAGTLGGTPTQVGTFQFVLQARDAVGATAQTTFTLTIASGLTIASAPQLPPGTSGVRYSVTLQPAGGTPPYVWAITAGALPAGIGFNSGVLEGTPSSAGTYTFTAQVTDGNSSKASKQFTLAVAGPLTITTAAALPGGVGGAPYRQTLAAAGGTPPYLWTVTGGSLPPGLTLEGPTGILSGTPSASGSFPFTVTLTDSVSVAVQRQFTIEIGQGVTITTPASLPDATAGTAYSLTLGAAGGQAPYSWSITGGSLPPALALSASSGAISGSPSAQGTYNFTVQVADAAGRTASRVHTIVVGLPSSSPSMTVNGVGATVAALQQPVIDIALASPYPVPITGRLNVSFAPGGAHPADDPSIQFSTGGRSAAFTIPANSTHATFASPQFALQVGSVAGTLTLTIDSLQANNTPLAAPAAVTAQVAASAPQIRSVTVVRQTGGFQVQVLAVSSTRELTQATVNFRPGAGSSLQTASAAVPLGGASNAWFGSAPSASYGGQFTLTLPFSFVGTAGGLDSVSVVLTNGAGASQESSGAY
jgi:large repetitive protein